MESTAVFWDRDKTLIADPGYINDPDLVELLPGSAEALRRLSEAGYQNIVVTNQSGIARGLLDEPALERIHDRLRASMVERGACIDAVYYCPYLDSDEAVVEQYRKSSDLRKPGPGMLVQASLERNIDLAGSWMIGDSLHDAQAGRAAGCRTILLSEDSGGSGKSGEVDFVARSLEEAVDIVLKHTQTGKSEEDRPVAGESTALLQEILTFLRTVDRRLRAEDFSLARLTGAVVQILALGVLVMVHQGDQMVRLLFGIFLQLIALTFFLISSKR